MDWIEQNPDKVKRADIVVGIPSYNEADSIAYPTEQAAMGLKTYFSDLRSVIINCDNNSPDGTKEAFFNTNSDVPKIYLSTPPGVMGKGSNFRNLFQKAIDLKAKGIVVVDADLKSINPQWIKKLGEPIFQGYNYVAPIYIRHKFDGTITNNIAYPMTRALYGQRIRQPIGGDFGLSGKLAKTYIGQKNWSGNVARFGIDIWMTTTAMTRASKICQAFLGCPKVHRAKDPGKALASMFKDVIETIFTLMMEHADFWRRVVWSKPTPIFGFGLGDDEKPPPVLVDEKNLYNKFIKGGEDFEKTWEKVLTTDNCRKLREAMNVPEETFEFPSLLWAKILYNYAIVFRDGQVDRDELLESLIPMYFGKVRSYVQNTQWMEVRQAEDYIEQQCIVFEEAKHQLCKTW